MKRTAFFLSLLLLLSAIAKAQNTNLRTHKFNTDKNHLAILGYDPVSYFTAGKAEKGKKEFSVVADGITYQFATEKNKELFKNNYTKYEPQYGGWCAYAMGAKGEKVEIDPYTFKIIDGKLYLFYNAFFNNTLKSWNKDEAALKQKADKNWEKIFHN